MNTPNATRQQNENATTTDRNYRAASLPDGASKHDVRANYGPPLMNQRPKTTAERINAADNPFSTVFKQGARRTTAALSP
jgi:hypothetical protein